MGGIRKTVNLWNSFLVVGILLIPLILDERHPNLLPILETVFLSIYLLLCPKEKILPFLHSDRKKRILFFVLSLLLFFIFSAVYHFTFFLKPHFWPFIIFWLLFGILFFIQDVKQKNFVKTTSFVLVQMLALPIFFVGMILWGDVQDYFAREKFDSNIWARYTDYKETATSSVRLRMLADLLENYDLKGKYKVKIKSLLGNPYPAKHYTEHCYYLGPEGGFASIDENLFLCFDFNADQKVVSVYQKVFR